MQKKSLQLVSSVLSLSVYALICLGVLVSICLIIFADRA